MSAVTPRRRSRLARHLHLPRTMVLALAVLAVTGTAWAEVRVIVGPTAGRAGREPDAAVVNEPFAVAFDRTGRLYAVEYTRGDRLFRVADPAAAAPAVEFVAGTFRSSAEKREGPAPAATVDGPAARFNGLHDVAIAPDGTVYLADTFNHRVCAFDPASGQVRVVAGTGAAGFGGDGGPATAATFNQAYCATLVPDGSALLVADIKNSRVRRVDLRTGIVSTVVGNGTAGRPVDGAAALATPLAGPRAACMAADGTIYVALREGNALVEVRGGIVRTVVNPSGTAGHGGDGGPGREARLAGPKYVDLDRSGRVLIADTENHCIRRYDPASGLIVTIAGTPPKAGAAVGSDLRSTELKRPHGCRIDPAGRLVIADSDNDRLVMGDLAD
jgi:sugar lactone lactonase YvrE